MKRSLWPLLVLSLAACQQSAKKQLEPAAQPVAKLYSEVRQITFVGPRAGEGYFSADGGKLIFQSERAGDNPFYQIFVKDLVTGETERISSGEGKTTCAWLHPYANKALYASTHKDPNWKAKAKQQIESKRRGQREKYSWSYDEYYDLYEADLKTKAAKPLAPAKGYDAEGSYSPDGEWIAFASNRHAYSGQLSAEEKKRLAEDPSFFLEIYLMKADGTGLRRLTEAPGYDGGPFFSPDGKSIVWRRFTTDGKIAEVWTMKIDGSEQTQITKLGAMSWAPYFHPSGDYLIFTTNLLGYDNFELYIVDTAGSKKPVRVTDWPGFDGLPVFSPDGRNLAWSHRNEKGESQIYMAKWDDELARKLLGLPKAANRPGVGVPRISASDAREWVEYLASAEMKGRRPGSNEEREYTTTIARQFARLGLSPVQGSNALQNFTYVSGVKAGPTNRLETTIKGQVERLIFNKDWAPASSSISTEVKPAEVVFAGFGIVAPAAANQAPYDAFKDLDIKNRWVMALKDLPNEVSNERRFHLNLYARAHHKALVARQAGAAGLILINESKDPVKLHYEGSGGETGIPVVEVSASVADQWLTATGKNLQAWRKQLDGGNTGGALIPDMQVGVEVALEPERSEAINVVAKINVPNAKGTILIGAHGDHLGFGESGNSLAKGAEKGQVHHGADDNASGVAAVMELAQALAPQIRSGNLRSNYNLAFAIWSAEELGVLGSSHFVKNYKGPKLVAYLNLDMVGRLRDQLQIQGIGSANEWPSVLEPLAMRTSVPLGMQEDPYLPSDGLAFYLKGVPSVSFFTGTHLEYHSPRDRAETLNFEGIAKAAEIVAMTVKTLAGMPALTYRKVEGGQSPMGGRGFRLYLGTVPDYAQEGIKGVRISGTTKSSPAEKAGLIEGDVIVQLGGTKIENIQDYVYCLQSMKANEKTSVKVLREGRIVELEIVPALKGS